MKDNLLLHEVPLDRILSLRHAVLRPDRPLAEARFDGDVATGTRHFGAFSDNQCVGCLSLMESSHDDQPAYQLRGMATHPEFKGQGIGRTLLEYALEAVDKSVVWCNARESAIGFYSQAGWIKCGPQFDITGIGPHVKMVSPPTKVT